MRHYGHWKADQAARRYTDPLPGYRARASGQAAAGAGRAGQGPRTGTCWVGAGQGTQARTRWVIPVQLLPTPQPPRDMRVGEFTGWRCWWVMDAGSGRYLLHSLFVQRMWAHDAPMLGDPDAPMERGDGRKLGVYTVKADNVYLAQVILGALQNRQDYNAVALVTGTVRLYGRVDEHEHGYRSEAAIVETIERVEWTDASISFDSRTDILNKLRAVYCPAPPPPPGIDSAQWTGRS